MFKKLINFTIFPIDFNKPWWHLAYQQKWLFLAVLFTVTVSQIFWSLLPFVVAKLFESESFLLCIVVFVSWFVIDLVLAIVRGRLNTKFQLQCIHSIYQNAHERLLIIDPQYHVFRSSGTVMAKIDRAAIGYEDFLDYLSFEIIPLIIGLITVVCAMTYYSVLLAFVMTLFVAGILISGYYFAVYSCQKWEKGRVHSDDAFKSTALENLTQIHLIRSTFATNYRFTLLVQKIKKNIQAQSQLWFAYIHLFTLMGSLYVISIFVLSMLLLWNIKTSIMTAATALGLLLTYIQSSKEIVRFGRLLRKTMHSKTVIKDLFEFIRNFGNQSFPVFGEAMQQLKERSTLSINASGIYFDYDKATLFNDHTFKLECTLQQDSKLFGIIGPSGSGKTTLLSILGGQLKPIRGTVFINSIDIYSVNDAMRSQLIVLQGQISRFC